MQPDPFIQAEQYIRSGDSRAALALLGDLVTRQPSNERAWLLMCDCEQRGEEMRLCLERAVQANPTSQVLRRRLEQYVARHSAPPIRINRVGEGLEMSAPAVESVVEPEAAVRWRYPLTRAVLKDARPSLEAAGMDFSHALNLVEICPGAGNSLGELLKVGIYPQHVSVIDWEEPNLAAYAAAYRKYGETWNNRFQHPQPPLNLYLVNLSYPRRLFGVLQPLLRLNSLLTWTFGAVYLEQAAICETLQAIASLLQPGSGFYFVSATREHNPFIAAMRSLPAFMALMREEPAATLATMQAMAKKSPRRRSALTLPQLAKLVEQVFPPAHFTLKSDQPFTGVYRAVIVRK